MLCFSHGEFCLTFCKKHTNLFFRAWCLSPRRRCGFWWSFPWWHTSSPTLDLLPPDPGSSLRWFAWTHRGFTLWNVPQVSSPPESGFLPFPSSWPSQTRVPRHRQESRAILNFQLRPSGSQAPTCLRPCTFTGMGGGSLPLQSLSVASGPLQTGHGGFLSLASSSSWPESPEDQNRFSPAKCYLRYHAFRSRVLAGLCVFWLCFCGLGQGPWLGRSELFFSPTRSPTPEAK